MKNIEFIPAPIHGEVRVPSSKSQAHRALICAALAGQSIVREVDLSNDITATANALKALGAGLSYDSAARVFTVGEALGRGADAGIIDCGESGSTLRFLIPLAAALGNRVTFVGGGRLPKRTTELYKPLLEANGAKLVYPTNGDFLPLEVSGELRGGSYSLRGDISSQFVTGLLIALTCVGGDSDISLTTRLESKPYADMTVDVLRRFGADIDDTDGYKIRGTRLYPRDFTVEGDCSQAAFFTAAAAINGDVTLHGINRNTLQGDFKLFDIAARFGAKVEMREDSIRVGSSELRACEIDAADIPDLVPALAVIAAYAEGETRIYNAARLRLKESDRIASTSSLLRQLGADVSETDDGLIIRGKQRLRGGRVSVAEYNDHRIAMSAAAASVGCTEPVIVDDMSSINKSYPEFLSDWNAVNNKSDIV